MSRGRAPNTAPYRVSYHRNAGRMTTQEIHTWADVCRLMRSLVVDGYTVTVEFC